MHAAKLKTANKKSLITNKSTALQNSTKRDPLVEKVSRMGNTRNPQEHAAVLKHAPANQQASNQQLLLMLQQQYGNDYVNQVLEIAQNDREETPVTAEAEPTEQPVVQAKMAMGQVGDKYEQEADRTAHQVIQKMSESETVSEEDRVLVEEETESPQIQQKCDCGDKENIQRKSDNTLQSEEIIEEEKKGSMEEQESEDAENEDLIIQRKPKEKNAEATPDLTRSLQQQKGKGQPLANPLKQRMEGAFGKDFSGVRIHADTEADRLTRSIKARAFTIGQDIFFRQGEYTPRSKQGQELLAHELTHVVQQGGSGDKASEDAGVKVSEVPEDMGIQRACAQCEAEKAEGMIQAKEAPGANSEREASADLCNENTSQESTQETPIKENVETTSEGNNPSDSCDGSATQESAQETTTEGDSGCGSGSDNSSALCDENLSQNSDSSCGDELECEQQQEDEEEETPKEDDKCPSEKEAPPEPEPENNSSESDNKSTSRMGADVASDIIYDDQKEQNKETTQPDDVASGSSASTCASLNRDTSASTSQISEPQVNLSDVSTNQLETSDNSPSKQNYKTVGEVTNPAFVAEKAQPITNATESRGQLNNKDTEISRLATLKINFKLPKQQETGKGNNVANLEKQRATASSMATDFFAEAGSRLQTVTGLEQSISDRIYGAAENVKAAVMSAVDRQKDTIVEQVNQQRAGLQDRTQATFANIEQQYQELLPKIFQETQTISQTIQEQYANTLDRLSGIQSDVHKSIAGHYAETIENYRHIGKVTGQTAIDKGEEKAQGWESQEADITYDESINAPSGGMQGGPPTLTSEGQKNEDLQTRAETAREVAKKYKEQIESRVEEQINNLKTGQEKDFENICCAIKKVQIQLQNGRDKHIESLDKFQQARVQQLERSVTKLRQCVRQDLQKNLELLDQQETAHLQILQGYADRQISAIEEDSQKAIASLHNGINQAVTQLIATLQNYHDEMQGIEAPDPDVLNAALAATLGQLDSSISAVQGQTEKAIVAAIDGINSGEQQVVNAVNGIAQSAITELETFNEEISNGFIQLEQDITDNFAQFLDDYTKTANREFAEKTQKCLDGIAEKVKTSLNCTAEKIGKALTDSVSKLYSLIEEKILGCLDTDIENYAERAVIEKKKQAAAMIAIVLGSVLVLGLIGFVGHILLVGFLVGVLAVGTTLAGILSAAIIGVITGVLGQLYSNAILGKDLSEDLLLAGFLGGFFGALGGAIAGKLPIANNLVKYGLEQAVQTGLEVASEAYGSLLQGEPITTESLVLAGVIGGMVNITTTPIPTVNKGNKSADISSTNPDIDTGNIPSNVNTDIDINAGNIPSDLNTETSRGLNRDNVPTTPKQQKILENTASKRGNELTLEELNTELDVAGKAKPESINDGEFIEQRELPNNHEWKEKEDGTWCRFSGKGDCMPGVEPNNTDRNATSRKRKRENSQNFQIDRLEPSEENPNQTVVKNNIFDLYSELDRLKFDTFKEFLQHLTNISKSNNRLDDLREMIGEHEFTDIYFQEARNSTKLRRSERNAQSPEQSKSEVFIQYLKHQLALKDRESSEDFTANLIYVLGGQKPSPRQGSFGDLQVNVTDTNITISGRPSFAKYTQEIKEVKPGQHRRHIVAWHTMREAMQKYLNQTDAANRDSQLNKLWKNSAIENKIKNEAIQIIKDKTPELQLINDLDAFQKLSLENKVKALLFIMNSNFNNLWVGKGYVNTAINTAFKKINDDLDKLNNSNDLENLREEYKTAEHNLGKGNRNTKQKKVIDEIEGIVAKFIRVKIKDNPEIKMKNFQKKVKEFLLNFEVDLLGSDAQFTDKDWVLQFNTKIKYAEVGIAINRILLGIDNNSLENQLKFLLKIDN